MKGKKFIPIIFILFAAGSVVQSQKTAESCAITYVANEGFLIETAKHKILVDALFGNIKGSWCDQPSDSVAGMMIKGLPPFKNIDVVLVTHNHTDHFNGPMIISFLKNNRKTELICPDQAGLLLRSDPDYLKVSDRIHSLESGRFFDTLLYINKINIRVLRFNHGSYFETDSVTGKSYDLHSNVENFGYLIDADGYKIFHSGDDNPANKEQYKAYNIGSKELDAVFLDRVFLRRDGQELMNEFFKTKNIIFMHIEPGRGEYYRTVIKSIPEMFAFTKSMEKKVIIK